MMLSPKSKPGDYSLKETIQKEEADLKTAGFIYP
jgi:hypothetical protein